MVRGSALLEYHFRLHVVYKYNHNYEHKIVKEDLGFFYQLRDCSLIHLNIGG